ncbi:MAG TPA: GAF domain-containing protein [Thermodesulfobacteriota bacterium]|jgi:GAF domain-containing protein
MKVVSFYDELRQGIKDLNILINLIQTVHISANLQEIYRVALDSATQLENVDMAMIYLVNEETHEAVLQAHRNTPEDYIRRAGRIPHAKGITWKVINTGKEVNIEDAQRDPDIGPAGRDLGHHSIFGLPITLGEKTIGVIWFISYKERKFNEREINLLSSFGGQITLAISKAKQTEELERRTNKLSILSTISQSVHSSVDLDQIY